MRDDRLSPKDGSGVIVNGKVGSTDQFVRYRNVRVKELKLAPKASE